MNGMVIHTLKFYDGNLERWISTKSSYYVCMKSSVDVCKIFLGQQTDLHYYLLYKKIMVTGCDSFMSIVEDWLLFSQFGFSCMIMKCTQKLSNVDSGCLGNILFDWVIYSSKGLVQKYIMQSREKKSSVAREKMLCFLWWCPLMTHWLKFWTFLAFARLSSRFFMLLMGESCVWSVITFFQLMYQKLASCH